MTTTTTDLADRDYVNRLGAFLLLHMPDDRAEADHYHRDDCALLHQAQYHVDQPCDCSGAEFLTLVLDSQRDAVQALLKVPQVSLLVPALEALAAPWQGSRGFPTRPAGHRG